MEPRCRCFNWRRSTSSARGPCLLFHYAFLGKERVAEMPLADYVAANARITEIVRRAVARLQPAGMFLTSSGAVYRADRSIETDLAANPYGVLKHRDEMVFAEACADDRHEAGDGTGVQSVRRIHQQAVELRAFLVHSRRTGWTANRGAGDADVSSAPIFMLAK